MRVLILLLLLTATTLAESTRLYVAVGYGGRRASSRDGVTWEHDQRWSDEAKDDDNILFNIAYGLGRFVAVGGGARVGHILTTRDGKEWKELPKLKGRVATIAFGKERFVATHGAQLLWSTDGETFHSGQKLDFQGIIHARKSVFGDGEGGSMFVVIGDIDLLTKAPKRMSWRATSSDGETWNSQAIDTPEARDIAYGSGHFVVVGPNALIESSHDGQNWSRRASSADEDFQSVLWTGQQFIAKGKKVWTSPDGINWSTDGKSIPCNPEWAREGAGGIGFSWGGNVFFSPDLQKWNKVPVPPGPSFTAVAAGQ